jgi:hypothetical protein
MWENVLDPQRFAILKEKDAFAEVVKSFSESLHNNVFALENQVLILSKWGVSRPMNCYVILF